MRWLLCMTTWPSTVTLNSMSRKFWLSSQRQLIAMAASASSSTHSPTSHASGSSRSCGVGSGSAAVSRAAATSHLPVPLDVDHRVLVDGGGLFGCHGARAVLHRETLTRQSN